MASVNLNGKDFELRYTIRDGIELRKRLDRPGIQIMSDIPGGMEGVQRLAFDLEALIVSIQVGIRHIREVNTDILEKWVQAHVDADKKLGELINPVVEAMLDGGCWGYKRQAIEAEDAAEGKAETPPETN